ncbi:MAG: FAD-binding protein, partial [Planctomycetales bacterium]|nr:FAD-binding protein [Planctomycetales bacterium]
IDITKDRIPVRPGAHYMMGGVTVDMQGRTTIPGLWAAGEVTSTGLHGANRLASNSLLEGLVYGAHAGEGASAEALKVTDDFRVLPIDNPPQEQAADLLDIADIRNSLKSLMWHSVGVRRDHAGLDDAAETIDRWCGYALNRQLTSPQGWELQNMLTIARLMVDAALRREESRGTHLRLDFPQLDDAHWRKHIDFRRDS